MASALPPDLTDVLRRGVVASEDEGLFARDVNGQLIRVEKATAADFDAQINVKIDGVEVTVPRAVPTRDSQGNVIRGDDGQPIPRYSTIYDAAAKAFVKLPGDEHPIPTLCHKEHLPPVGVCRVCVVEAAEMTRRGPRKQLVPACVQRVSDGMEIHTVQSTVDPAAAERVRAAASVVTELLIADHLPQVDNRCATPAEAGPGNELAKLAARLNIEHSRFSSNAQSRGQDTSSLMIAVDHDQCIMCGRCIRGCNWVKENKVIGRAGKGYTSHIAFDLDDPMGSSDCVSCGECAISCPTGALEFTQNFIQSQTERVEQDLRGERRDGEIVSPEELVRHRLFSGIPFKFLQFNGSSVVRRLLKAGDVLCREGEYGATAFIIENGRFEIFLSSKRGSVRTERASGIAGLLGGLKTFVARVGGSAKLADVGAASLADNERIFRDEHDVILGEMTCMNRYPRSATVVAAEDCEVLEIRRNVLHMLQRNEVSRNILENAYRSRALIGQLHNLNIFSSLDDKDKQTAAEFLKNRAELIQVDPGQTVFAQGDRADDFYVVKLGFIKVTQKYGQDERVLNYIGPGRHFGEIGLLSKLGKLLDLDSETASRSGVRTATCSALDHVELIRIRGADFSELLVKYPRLGESLKAAAEVILDRDEKAREKLQTQIDHDFLDQGLFGAGKLLVIDLERCTRCDECTKACADTHGGVTRLIRDGMRYDRFLIASSCRSCMDPYCMVGCPVDAIHRSGESLEINIEDYCIGCGLCAENCPYGNINMHPFPKTETDPKSKRELPIFQLIGGKNKPVYQQRATTCDLCSAIDGRPSCVYACPHDAAFRVSSERLRDLIEE